MNILTLSAIFLTAFVKLYGEDGLEYKGDIDRDGIQDFIQSGPRSMFGNAGGPFVIFLSKSNKKINIGGNGSWTIERGAGWIRLWSYWRMSSNSGEIGYIEIDLNSGQISNKYLTISPGDSGTELGNEIIKTIFDKNHENLQAEVVHDYIPPKLNADGLEWGK